MPNRPIPRGDEDADDAAIADDVVVVRRIPPGRWYHADDERPHSDNFANSPDGSGTSVDIVDPDYSLTVAISALPPGFGAVLVKVSDIRAAGLGIVRNPIPGNPFHATMQGKKRESVRKRLCKSCRTSWAKKPDC